MGVVAVSTRWHVQRGDLVQTLDGAGYAWLVVDDFGHKAHDGSGIVVRWVSRRCARLMARAMNDGLSMEDASRCAREVAS